MLMPWLGRRVTGEAVPVSQKRDEWIASKLQPGGHRRPEGRTLRSVLGERQLKE